MKYIRTGFLVLVGWSLSHSADVASKDRAATEPESKVNWHCPRPPLTLNSDRTRLHDVAGPEEYSSELRCLVKWLNDYSDAGALAGSATASVYEDERKRARVVLKHLSDWTDSRRITERGRPSEADEKKSVGFYLSGVEFYKKGEYDKARMNWNVSLELNPGNALSIEGIRRIKNLYEPDSHETLPPNAISE